MSSVDPANDTMKVSAQPSPNEVPNGLRTEDTPKMQPSENQERIAAQVTEKKEDLSPQPEIEQSLSQTNSGPIVKKTDSEEEKGFRSDALIGLVQNKIKRFSHQQETLYNRFVQQPSSHPSYVQTWKAYYLQESFNISRNDSFNYLPSWRTFWATHLQQLKQQEIQLYEDKIRTDLQIPVDVELKHMWNSVHELSDISDEDLELESPPKRRKLNNQNDFQREPAKHEAKMYTEKERMMIAYDLAFKSFQEGKRLDLDELSLLVSRYCNEPRIHLSDNDLKFLHKNYSTLSQNDKTNFNFFIRNIELTDPERFKNLKLTR